jgi:hypothetical protein
MLTAMIRDTNNGKKWSIRQEAPKGQTRHDGSGAQVY